MPLMSNVLVPELSVRDWRVSLMFYRDLLGFSCRYIRADEGFAFLERDGAQIMIDQIGLGRDFDSGIQTLERPFGRGLNLQIRVAALDRILSALTHAGVTLHLPLEEKWYDVGEGLESGNRQFVVADPDGYLLRFYEDLGERRV
ncbi:bleomycin resistance family protein [Rhizobium rhizosphaerae]|nr:bleomycin resistance family protein [Xaviernesmea rhizosphaerae]